jgi:hypothetical protein
VSDPVVDFIPTADPLMRDPCLAYVVELPVLGIATRFETNSRYVHDLTVEAFGSWACLPRDAQAFPPGGLRVRIVVREGDEGGAEHAPVRYFCPDSARELVHSPGSLAISDPLRGESLAYVTTAFAADRTHFRRMLLEGTTLGLLSRYDRHPVHAAAIGHAGRAVLLAGPSGSGKSTLAYAAYRAGLDVLADDNVWVQVQPKLRVWGWPGRVLLLPETASKFPEAAGVGRTSEINGDRKLAYDVDRGATVSQHVADRAVVCILDRRRGKAGLEPLPPAAVVDGLTRQLTSGFDLFADQHDTVIRALAGDGGWRLTLSEDPREALPLLRTMLADGARE